MKKILISFVLGVFLSVIPIAGLAASGTKSNLDKFIKKNFTVTKKSTTGCDQTFDQEFNFDGFRFIVECELEGEVPDDGDGVSVCWYECIIWEIV